jgi:sigma-B regulation protein RsbU (phosphoserine phosphatase)
MKILVVEEDRTSQNLLRTWLEEWSHSVTTSENGQQASELLTSGEFDLVLSNWTLKELDGLGLCRLIRQSLGPDYLYVILYTSTTIEPDYVSGMDAGADDFISNPFDAARLRVRIRAAERILSLQHALAEQNESLNTLNEKLASAFAAIESDLQAASTLQLSLLPTVSDIHPRFSLDWLVLPSSFLAGDNLNYFMMQDRYLVFYHLDVAGHGIPSALLSVTLNQLLSPQPGSPMVRFDPKLELKRIVPPVEVVSELNRRFQPQGDGYFTMIYGVLDTETCEIRLCQAGHPSALKIDASRSITTVGDGGFPVGLWPDMTYDETTTTLKPGERLVLYSDGILECTNLDEARYSLEQLKHQIVSNADAPIKDVLLAIRKDLEQWSQGRDYPDDISILIIDSKGYLST